MISLNDSNIFIGQIKQVLKNFNLPRCPIGEENRQTNNHYIEKNKIYLAIDEKDEETKLIVKKDVDLHLNYIYNKYYHNLTTNLDIENNLYDRYTHRYLGEYLRFIRDYKNVDLMCMYNCFDQEIFNKAFEFQVPYLNGPISDPSTEKIFTSNSNYTVYSIPIKLNKKYILNLSCNSVVEGCLYINNPRLLNDVNSEKTLKQIASTSYFKYTFYNTSYILDLFKSFNKGDSDKVASLRETITEYNKSLRLLLKVPSTLKSSISMIELNKTDNLPFFTKPQLFNYTNNKNYLLSDKLIEYLTGNAICPLSEDYDTEKVQRCLNNLPYIQGNSSEQSYYGKWSDYDTGRIIYFIWVNKLQDKYFDLLGYCDKDIEKELNIAISNNINTGGII